MADEKKEHWRELCEEAVRETDPQRLLELVQEINKILTEEEGPSDEKKSA